MLDLSLLRIAKHREDFKRIRGRIPDSTLDAQTRALLEDYGKYFDRFDHTKIDLQTFLPMFRAWHPSIGEDKRASYEAILVQADQDVSPDTRTKIMQTLLELRLATDMALLAEQFNDGNVQNLYGKLTHVVDDFKKDSELQDVGCLETDIEDILKMEADDDQGLSWRLECLNRSMRRLRTGDFGIIAGRPDQGKTTLVASEVTYLGSQLGEGECVLWLNNEGIAEKIMFRVWQSALGANKTQLLDLMNKRLLKPAYTKVMGDLKRVRIANIHGFDCFQVEQLIEKFTPKIVVFDMIDNIRGFGEAARTDLGLERMYQWGRELAVSHGFAGIATSQISAEGDNMQFPAMSMLKDSKTGKQGACDFQIMIGSKLDPGYQQVRWIGVPKNKLRRDTGPADPRATVKYDPLRARYEDLPMAMPESETEVDGATTG